MRRNRRGGFHPFSEYSGSSILDDQRNAITTEIKSQSDDYILNVFTLGLKNTTKAVVTTVKLSFLNDSVKKPFKKPSKEDFIIKLIYHIP